MFHERTTHAAKGKWRGILLELGVPESFLRDVHGPCPLCGGKDRFRWDNKEGAGTYICGQCGAGDGMKLAVEFTGQPFKEVAGRIDAIVGNLKPDQGGQKRELSDDDRRRILREAFAMSRPIGNCLADKYLHSRGVGDTSYPETLRFIPSMRDGEGGVRPCMVALIGVYGEPKFCSMHRTFLRPDGLAKAEMTAPRKMMPGDIPPKSAVRLSDWPGSGPLGIAEGVETALSAAALYGLPVWSALASPILKKWWPPEGCDEVVIFGDNDPKFGGQAAAYDLAHRLAVAGIDVTVKIPDTPGEDWNDILMRKTGKGRGI